MYKLILPTLILISFFMVHCTTTTTSKKDPVFSIPEDSVAREINSIILSERISVYGKETRTNGKSKSELKIGLIDTKLLTDDTSELYEIGEQVASLAKFYLKDPSQFDYFEVTFVRKKTQGSQTNFKHSGQIYTSSELKSSIYIATLGNKLDSSTSRAIGKNVFSGTDPQIVTTLKYYNVIPHSTVRFRLTKETDSDHILILNEEIGKTNPDENYFLMQIKIRDFYDSAEYGSGNYKIEYLVNDSVAGTRAFRLL